MWSLLLIALVACKAGPEKLAFTTTAAAGMTIEAGIGEFNTYIKTHPGEIPKEKILQVRNAAIIYDAALDTVALTITAIKSGKATDSDYQVAIAASRAAASNLSALLSTINFK